MTEINMDEMMYWWTEHLAAGWLLKNVKDRKMDGWMG